MNILAIALATLASFIIGWVWFNGKTFYPVWYRALGKEVPQRPETFTDEDKREAGMMFGGTFLSQVGQSIALAWIVDAFAKGYGSMNAGFGALIGLVLGLGISGFSSLPHRLFSQQGFKVWAIEVSGDIVALIAMGAIIGAFAA